MVWYARKVGEEMAVRNMTRCALFVALLTVCAWLSVHVGGLVFSLQSFAVFLTLGTLGGRRGTVCVGVYLALGAVGLPVFSGFRGGMGVLLGPTGGYIWGFWISALVYWLFTALFKDNSPVRLISLCLGLVLCYLLGSLWYMHAYLHGQSFIFVLAKCVLPYCLPDACKLTLAFTLSDKLKNHIKIK